MARSTKKRIPKKKADRRPPKRRVCIFCSEDIAWIDYKDADLLKRYMSERAKIRARRVTGNCSQHQREVSEAIKLARELALLPYAQRQVTVRKKSRQQGGGGPSVSASGPPPAPSSAPPPPPRGSSAGSDDEDAADEEAPLQPDEGVDASPADDVTGAGAAADTASTEGVSEGPEQEENA